MTRDEARTTLATMASGIPEPDLAQASERLLERIAGRDDAVELRGFLTEMGAALTLQAVREVS